MLDRIFKGHATKIRISMGLVGMVVSLFLVAAMLGLFPDRALIISQQRATLAEALAVNSSAFITLSDINRLETDLNLVVERNDDILSAALINSEGEAVVVVGDHLGLWINLEDAISETGSQISVPLLERNKIWGHLQLRFTPLRRAGIIGNLDDPVFHTITFVSLFAFLFFLYYLGYMLKQLDPSQAIPGRVRSALDTMAEGLLVLDAKKNIMLANQAFATLVGEPPGKLLGRSIDSFGWDSVGDEAYDSGQAPWSIALSKAKPIMSMRIKMRLDANHAEHANEPSSATKKKQNGAADLENAEYATFMTNCSPVMAAEGKPQGVLISFDDVTELEQKEIELKLSKEEAEAANRSKSEFLANMSHEIRTPMNAILGFTEVLQRGYGSQEDSKKYLDTISSSGNHLLTLINDILDLSKVEAGKIEIETVESEPHKLIHEIITIMRVKAQEKDLTLEFEPTSEMPEFIKTDIAKVRQILINLLGNALKFTEQGGVTVSGKFNDSGKGQGQLILAVIDTGVGMTEEQAGNIFESFVQADTSISRRFGGTGLGLSISKKFALALGGDILITSKPDVGSTFTLSIPVAYEPGTSMLSSEALKDWKSIEARSAEEGRWAFNGQRVLVIDDGAENRNLLQLVLNEVGLEVDIGTNGLEGLTMAQKTSYDVILMDVQMPVMDGLTAVGKMRDAGLTLPVLALTADAMKGVEEQCKTAGYSDYMPKPISLEGLLKYLGELLGGHFEAQQTTASEAKAERQGEAEKQREEVEEPLLMEVIESPPGPIALPPLVSTLQLNPDRVAGLVRQFKPRLMDQITTMNDAITAGDGKALADLAHWLKGSAGSMGFHDFTEPATALGTAAKHEDFEGAAASLSQIRDLAHRISIDGEMSNHPIASTKTDTPSAGSETPQAADETPIKSALPLTNPKLRTLVAQFQLRLRDQLEAMRKARDNSDFDQLFQLGHWLKGSAGTVGYHVFTEVSSELENAARAEDVSSINIHLTKIENLVDRIEPIEVEQPSQESIHDSGIR